MSDIKLHSTTSSTTPEGSPISTHVVQLTHISGAYDTVPAHLRKRINAFVSKDDYEFVFVNHMAAHGMKAKILAGLMHAFTKAYRDELSKNPIADPYEVGMRLVNATNFHPTPTPTTESNEQ